MSYSTWPGYRPGHAWTCRQEAGDVIGFSRPLGVLEQRFEVASAQGGQSDTFIRLDGTLSPSTATAASETDRSLMLTRLFLSWCRLRSKHPLLAATIHDGPADLIPGCPSRRFDYVPPMTDDEAVQRGRDTFLVANSSGSSLTSRMDEIQDQTILNGDRTLLQQDLCLARVVVVLDETDPSRLGFFLVVSHVISDGLSVFNLVNELFAAASSSRFPTPSPIPTFLDFDRFLAGHTHEGTPEVPAEFSRSWDLVRSREETIASLPLATEDHLPELPIVGRASASPGQPVEAPSDHDACRSPSHHPAREARRRWIWAITRVLILQRQRRFPHSLHIPRKSLTPPPNRARTRWDFVRFSKETSASLFRFCKRNGQSPSMLLYSMLSLSTANLLAALHPGEPYHPVLVGFPFSARRFLEHSSIPSSDPSSDVAIRITFGSIHLPSMPLDLDKDSVDREAVRRAAVRNARLAKRQFDRRLAPDPQSRTIFFANGWSLNMDRLLTRFGCRAPPWEDPKTAINASMIGDVDRILPTTFKLPLEGRDVNLRLENLQLGTRLHLGEGLFNEGFTFDGMLQFSMGSDDQFMHREHVDALLDGIKRIGETIAAGEGD
ncbi:hypothetical protein JCM10212_001160 [Sporobolomyces blumeae]